MSFMNNKARGERPSPPANKVGAVQGKFAGGLTKKGQARGAVGKAMPIVGCAGTVRSSSGSSQFKPGAVSGSGASGSRLGAVKGKGLGGSPMGATRGRP